MVRGRFRLIDLFREVLEAESEEVLRQPSPPGFFDGAMGFGARALSDRIREAHARGMRLLEENLSPTQRAQFKKRGYFDVIGGDSRRHYRIRYGSQANVQLLDWKGRPVCVLCFMPRGDLVAGDNMLAQKLALELFEAEALKIANKFPADLSPLGSMP